MCRDVGADNIWFCPSNRFHDNTGRTQFKFLKGNELHYLEKPDVDYDDPAFNRGFKLSNERDLQVLKQV